jgi:hypothetical protein
MAGHPSTMLRAGKGEIVDLGNCNDIAVIENALHRQSGAGLDKLSNPVSLSQPSKRIRGRV